MQRITTATHELLIFTDSGQTHVYRWPLGQSPLPLAGALGPQTARGQINPVFGMLLCRRWKAKDMALAGKSLSEIREYLDYWENQ